MDKIIKIEGERDPKPFKVDRVTRDGQFVSRVAEYATEDAALKHPRRLDWNYSIYAGRRKIWPNK